MEKGQAGFGAGAGDKITRQIMSGGPVYVFYVLALALWTGGMAIFTLLVTPAIFRSYGRDKAGEIVGRLFPGYFLHKLVLSAFALVFFLLLGGGDLQLALLVLAFLVNVFHRFLLYPVIRRVKETVSSFEADAGSAVRKRFRNLHAVSMLLNLAVLLIGLVLLILAVGPL